MADVADIAHVKIAAKQIEAASDEAWLAPEARSNASCGTWGENMQARPFYNPIWGGA
jgi:hypothetical protein